MITLNYTHAHVSVTYFEPTTSTLQNISYDLDSQELAQLVKFLKTL